MVLDQKGQYASQWEVIRSLVPKIGCPSEATRIWVQRAAVDLGCRPGISSDDRKRLTESER